MNRGRARLAALAAAVLFSTGGAAIKVAVFSAAQVSALRSGIAALVLLLALRRSVSWSRGNIIVGVAYAATMTLFVAATKLTTAANATFLQATAPLYILLLAPPLLGERVTRRDGAYVAGVAAGTALCLHGQSIATSTAPDPARGNVFGVLAAVAYALTLIGLRFLERGRADTSAGLSSVIMGNALACFVALPWAMPLPHASAAEWGTVVYLGAFQIGVAYVCLMVAMRHLPALEVSLLLLLEPVLNPVWTWIIRGEQPGNWVIAGGAVIIGATGMRSVFESRRSRGSDSRQP